MVDCARITFKNLKGECGGVLETTREMWGGDMGVREKCGEGGMGVC